VFIDIFRSQDLSGGGKALWFLFVLFIPLIGCPGVPDRPWQQHA
jgi:Phospholipase_D-nuclease N-terminal